MKLTLTTALLCCAFCTQAQPPSLQWQKSLGGPSGESGYDIRQTTDGGYIACGISTAAGGDVSAAHGLSDFWVIKLTNTGAISWEKSLGGTGDDEAFSIIQTTDGGYVVTGWAESNDGDVTPNANHGGRDAWVVKLSSTGTIQWQNTIGGTQMDYFNTIRQTPDGGYVATGFAMSGDNDVPNTNHGSGDMWVVKMNDTGAVQWSKVYGGSGIEYGFHIETTTGGGYIVTGQTTISDGDVSGVHGVIDAWVVKLNDTGAIQWQKAYGGTNSDIFLDIRQTADGGYIAVGTATSNDGDVTGYHNLGDVWLVKLNATGAVTWNKCLGGDNGEVGSSVLQAADDGYFIAAQSTQAGGDVTVSHGSNDIWAIKTDAAGAITWQRSLGSSGYDYCNMGLQTSDGNFVIAGTVTVNDGDVTNFHGQSDVWLVKLGDPAGVNDATVAKLAVYPNPANDMIRIELPGNTLPTQLRVCDMSGSVMSISSINTDHATVQMNSLPAGCYTVSVTNEKMSVTRMIVKR